MVGKKTAALCNATNMHREVIANVRRGNRLVLAMRRALKHKLPLNQDRCKYPLLDMSQQVQKMEQVICNTKDLYNLPIRTQFMFQVNPKSTPIQPQ